MAIHRISGLKLSRHAFGAACRELHAHPISVALKHGFAIGGAHKAVFTAQTQTIVVAEPSVQMQFIACKTGRKIGEHMLRATMAQSKA